MYIYFPGNKYLGKSVCTLYFFTWASLKGHRSFIFPIKKMDSYRTEILEVNGVAIPERVPLWYVKLIGVAVMKSVSFVDIALLFVKNATPTNVALPGTNCIKLYDNTSLTKFY